MFAAYLEARAASKAKENQRIKTPYNVLLSNVTTNILTCVSAYHAKGEPFHPEMLAATVAETAGLGAEAMLKPDTWGVFVFE